MATTNIRQECSTCSRQTIVYPCPGCSKNYCMEHLKEHRDSLAQQFNVLQNDCDRYQKKLIDKNKDSKYDSLIQQIDQWEQDSIKKIIATAKQARDILNKPTKTNGDITTKLTELVKQIHRINDEKEYNELDLNRMKSEFENLTKNVDQMLKFSIQLDSTPFINKISIATSFNIPQDSQWAEHGVTIAGGYGKGTDANQLNEPYGVYIDEDQTIYIVDWKNHRVVQWKPNATSGEVVAGGNGQGNRSDQLNQPTDVIVDKETNSLIICDRGNKRVIQWSLRNGTTNGQVILENIACQGLTMDDRRCLYISDNEKYEVRRYRMGETNGVVVAGGNGSGNRLNQLNSPTYICVDRDYSLYVSEYYNNRVTKWKIDATEGVIVAGGQVGGSSLDQLSIPLGIFVDGSGTVYVSDRKNHRVTRWCKEKRQGEIIAGGNGRGRGENQLFHPDGLTFDQNGNLYVVDGGNHRVQRFAIKTN